MTGNPSLLAEETGPNTTTTTGSHEMPTKSQAGSHLPAMPQPQLLSARIAGMLSRVEGHMDAFLGRVGAGSASSEPDRDRGPIYEVLSQLMEQQRQQHAESMARHAELCQQLRQQHAELLAMLTEHVAAFQQNAGASPEHEDRNSGGAA